MRYTLKDQIDALQLIVKIDSDNIKEITQFSNQYGYEVHDCDSYLSVVGEDGGFKLRNRDYIAYSTTFQTCISMSEEEFLAAT